MLATSHVISQSKIGALQSCLSGSPSSCKPYPLKVSPTLDSRLREGRPDSRQLSHKVLDDVWLKKSTKRSPTLARCTLHARSPTATFSTSHRLTPAFSFPSSPLLSTLSLTHHGYRRQVRRFGN